jgi:transcriptional regulator with XRE-family HTH domain
MTKGDFIKIRHKLGLTQAQLATVLGFARRNYVCALESRSASGRNIPPLVARLMRAYRDGYRPLDWPGLEQEQETGQ